MDQPEIERIGNELYFVSASPAARRLRTQAELFSQADIPVLITGESGSGKATAAQLVHSLSLRSGFQFVQINCGALTPELLERELFGSECDGINGDSEFRPGKFEQCARGTVLLEDFDAMPGSMQDRLLRLLETRELVRCGGRTPVAIDIRLIATMSVDCERGLAENESNHDLYHRLSVFRLRVPPLRERREEIPLLLGHFMNRLTRRYGVPARQFTKALLDACQRYLWPGNLRELENFVKRFLAIGDERAALEELYLRSSGEETKRRVDENGVDSIPANLSSTEGNTSLKVLVRNAKGEAERTAIVQALEQTNWNRTAAARLLHISYRGLLYKIEEYRLARPAAHPH